MPAALPVVVRSSSELNVDRGFCFDPSRRLVEASPSLTEEAGRASGEPLLLPYQKR